MTCASTIRACWSLEETCVSCQFIDWLMISFWSFWRQTSSHGGGGKVRQGKVIFIQLVMLIPEIDCKNNPQKWKNRKVKIQESMQDIHNSESLTIRRLMSWRVWHSMDMYCLRISWHRWRTEDDAQKARAESTREQGGEDRSSPLVSSSVLYRQKLISG